MREELLERAVELFGTTQDCRRGGFILPDGSLLDFGNPDRPNHSGQHRDHSDIGQIYTDEEVDQTDDALTSDFIKQTGSMRYSSGFNTHYAQFNKNKKLTKDQIEALEYCMCFTNIDAKKRLVYDAVDFTKGHKDKDRLVFGELHDDNCFAIIEDLKKMR